MPFSYDARPSFWQKIKSNSHLVIAAVGTVALLGVAGAALWLAMPAGDRQAFAQVEQPAAGADAPAQAEQAQAAGQSAPVSSAPVAVVEGGAVTLPAAEAQDDIAALQANDPRWSGTTHKQARRQADAATEAQKEAAPATVAPPPVPTPEQAASVAAFQPTQDGQAEPTQEAAPAHANPDKAETAAIPAAKPAVDAAAQGNGHILRAVTMRSGPKKGAAAIGTIPAKAAVQVMSCKSWCQVAYKGKQGWIYKSFLQRD